MAAIYNEIDPSAAQWTRNLVAAGHVVPGEVLERSIAELGVGDVREATQAHFFSGIAAWSHALRLAGWPDDCEVWTGSCPCQGFSNAGRRGGFDDARHLWPEWFRLIRECRPPVILGEQVASPLGRQWLDLVCADLEGAGYAVGKAVLGAHGVGAPHIRQRTYLVALADGERLEGVRVQLRKRRSLAAVPEARRGGEAGFVADHDHERRGPRWAGGADGWPSEEPAGLREVGLVGDPREPGGRRDAGAVPGQEGAGEGGGEQPGDLADVAVPAGSTRGFWDPCDWVACRDGRWRPVEPGAFPLAHGVAGRVGKLRAYGNAIVPQVAQAFIESVIDVLVAGSAGAPAPVSPT